MGRLFKIKRLAPLLSALCLLAICSGGSAALDMAPFGRLEPFSNPADISMASRPMSSLKVSHVNYNNVIPAIEFYSDLSGPYYRGNDAFATQAQDYEISFSSGNFGFGYTLAIEDEYVATGDTVRALQDIQNGNVSVGRTYDVGLTYTREKMEYYRFYYSTPVRFIKGQRFWFGSCFKLMNGIAYEKATLTGSAEQVDEDNIGFNFDLESTSSGRDSHGSGWAMDMGLAWEPNDKLAFDAVFKNVAGQMNWYSIGYSTAHGASDNVSRDEFGNTIVYPSLSGYSDVRDITIYPDFEALYGLTYKYRKNISLSCMIEPYVDRAYYSLGCEWLPSRSYKVRVGYVSKYDAVTAGLEWGILRLDLMANDLTLGDATSLSGIVVLTI